MNYGKRLKEARNYLGLTQSEFAENILLKWDKIKNIETEKHKLTPELAEKIEQKYSINGWWLLTGRGNMLFQEADSIQIEHNNDNYAIDLLNIRAGAGEGVYNYEVEVIDKIVIDKIFFRTKPDLKKVKIIEVDGDSMEPTIKDGDYVIIDESKVDRTNGIYAIQLDGQLLIKRLQFKLDGTVLIISDNNRYDPEIYNPKDSQLPCKIIGRKVLTIQR